MSGEGRRRHGGHDRLINVSDLNEFLYCPRRYWYRVLFAVEGWSKPFDDGQRRHERQARRHDGRREQYYRDDDLGLHGRVDLVERDSDPLGLDAPPTPVERKHSTDYYWNDEVQLAGYCLLINRVTEREVTRGYIYLYKTDTRHEVTITADHRTAVTEAVDRMQSLSPTDPPSFVDNPNKCEGCAVRHVCLPATTSRLEPDQAADSGWTTEAATSADPSIRRGDQS